MKNKQITAVEDGEMYENNPETFVSRNTIGSNQITKWT